MRRTLDPMGFMVVGVQQVRCPVCRAQEGRPCTNRRGYLVRAHQLRADAWVALEAADAAGPLTRR